MAASLVRSRPAGTRWRFGGAWSPTGVIHPIARVQARVSSDATSTTGWLRPPRLATSEDRTATRLELFYDLAYVLVVAELAAAFLQDMSWRGAAVFALLFAMMWFSWVSTTLYANRFDTDDVLFRIALLVDTAAVAGCAAAATGGIGSASGPVAACFLLRPLGLVGVFPPGRGDRPGSRTTNLLFPAPTPGSAGPLGGLP